MLAETNSLPHVACRPHEAGWKRPRASSGSTMRGVPAGPPTGRARSNTRSMSRVSVLRTLYELVWIVSLSGPASQPSGEQKSSGQGQWAGQQTRWLDLPRRLSGPDTAQSTRAGTVPLYLREPVMDGGSAAAATGIVVLLPTRPSRNSCASASHVGRRRLKGSSSPAALPESWKLQRAGRLTAICH